MASSSLSLLARVSEGYQAALPPLFLAPAFASPFKSLNSHARSFSSSNPKLDRKSRRDKNKQRGVSAIRATGPRHLLSISKYPLPVPVFDPPARKEFKTSPKHGLWGFFNKARTPMSAPDEDLAFGRAWTYQELTYKGWHDLHRLYWVCIKERNRISTSNMERHRMHAGYGDWEAEQRDDAVRETQERIRKVLHDRWQSWALFHGETRPLVDEDEQDMENSDFEDELPEDLEEPSQPSQLEVEQDATKKPAAVGATV